MKTIAFFNNKGGVGKTTTVYHIAWMMSELGYKVLTVDLDPQSNLSSMFLTQERMERVILDENNDCTILDAVLSISSGNIYNPVHIEKINDNISLLIGNLSLSAFEDKLSDSWLKCLAGDEFGFKVTSVFKTLFTEAAKRVDADFVLIDVGPNLGAMNRSILINVDNIVIPVAPDLFSLQGIKNLGNTIKDWRKQSNKRNEEFPVGRDTNLIPNGKMHPLGYIVMQYSARESRPVKSYVKWVERIPEIYKQFVMPNDDSNELALLKHYHSLAPMSMEAHKPMFLLKPSDGAFGAHSQSAQNCYKDFEKLTKKIIEKSI